MKLLSHSAILAFAGLVLMLSHPASASAAGTPLTICNQTSSILGVAVGYHSSGVADPADHSILTGPFVSQGWTGVKPGTCVNFANPFGARYMFWFGFSPEVNNNDIVVAMGSQTPGVHFCATDYFGTGTPAAFTFEDENASLSACQEKKNANGTYNLFLLVHKVDVEVNSTVNFTGSWR